MLDSSTMAIALEGSPSADMQRFTTADEDRYFHDLGQLGLRDEFVFGRIILGYHWLTGYHRQWLVQKNNHPRQDKMRLRSRGTGKSTVHTVIDTLWEACRDVTCRQLIANAVADKAVAFLSTIRDHVNLNPVFRRCYPWMEFDEDQKTQVRFAGRNKRYKRPEPSIMAIGARTAVTASHWDIIRCDDVVSEKDMMSSDIRQGTIEWFKRSRNLLMRDGFYDVTGTPWHKADLYKWIEDQNRSRAEGRQWIIDRQGAIGSGGRLEFPEIYSAEHIKELQRDLGASLFASQVLVNPLPEETQLFSKADMTLFMPSRAPKNEYVGYCCYVDPATGKSRTTGNSRVDMDSTAITVGGIHIDGHVDVVRALKAVMPSTRLAEILCDLHGQYHFTPDWPIFIEANAFQEVLAEYINHLAKQRGISLPISLVINTESKAGRIAVCEPLWASGFVRFRNDWQDHKEPLLSGRNAYAEYIEEVCDFPVADHDDAPDGMAGLLRAVMKRLRLETARDRLRRQTVGLKGIAHVTY